MVVYDIFRLTILEQLKYIWGIFTLFLALCVFICLLRSPHFSILYSFLFRLLNFLVCILISAKARDFMANELAIDPNSNMIHLLAKTKHINYGMIYERTIDGPHNWCSTLCWLQRKMKPIIKEWQRMTKLLTPIELHGTKSLYAHLRSSILNECDTKYTPGKSKYCDLSQTNTNHLNTRN